MLSKMEWDSVLIAGLAEPKQRIFRNLHLMIKNRKLDPKNRFPFAIATIAA
ncbi:MAG: hypothetical protein AB9861_14875 [Methanosarcina sp.]